MSSDNGSSKPRPTFDFGQVSRKWGKRWGALMAEATEIQAQALEQDEQDFGAIEDEKARRKAMATFARAQASMLGRLTEIGYEQEKLMAQVLVDVPREWLEADAPESIDWSDPENLDYLLENKGAALTTALNEERQANLKN